MWHSLAPSPLWAEGRGEGCGIQRSIIFVRLAGLTLLGLLIGAVQLLPTFDALRESQRQAADGEFSQQGAALAQRAPARSPLSVSRPRRGGNTHEFGLYVGAIPVALIAWLLLRRVSLGSRAPYRRLAAVALAGTGLAIWLALGRAGLLSSARVREIRRRPCLEVSGGIAKPDAAVGEGGRDDHQPDDHRWIPNHLNNGHHSREFLSSASHPASDSTSGNARIAGSELSFEDNARRTPHASTVKLNRTKQKAVRAIRRERWIGRAPGCETSGARVPALTGAPCFTNERWVGPPGG